MSSSSWANSAMGHNISKVFPKWSCPSSRIDTAYHLLVLVLLLEINVGSEDKLKWQILGTSPKNPYVRVFTPILLIFTWKKHNSICHNSISFSKGKSSPLSMLVTVWLGLTWCQNLKGYFRLHTISVVQVWNPWCKMGCKQRRWFLSEFKYKQLYYWPQKKFPIKLILKFLPDIKITRRVGNFSRDEKFDFSCEQKVVIGQSHRKQTSLSLLPKWTHVWVH